MQAVVVPRPAVVLRTNASVVLAFLWILQIKAAALVRVAVSGANSVADAVYCAGAESKEYRWIQLIAGHQVGRAAADIARRHQPVGSKLALETQVPLIDDGRLRIIRVRRNKAKGGKRSIPVDYCREGISARIV